jgi:DNA primase
MTNADPVVDIKGRLSIEDVVRPYVELKRAGRSLKGLCPWHAEKTPSFNVSLERQLAYCFGCSKGGDMFTFIQEMEGVDFKGAIDILAEKAGLDMAQYKSSMKAPKVSKDHKDELYHINVEASKFYQENLRSTKEGKKVLKYLEERGMTAETVDEFGLGLSPDSFNETFNHLVQKKCSKADLLELGLLSSKSTTSEKVYDKFRLRLMFPIWDQRGKIVGFGGRALKKEDQPKYMNSPESPIYHKSDVMYGFYRAKKAVREKDLAIVVEGYMDVMASHQAGVLNVVASSGTALTEHQVKLIKRFTKNVAFAFDTDSAGEEALRRAIEMGQSLGMNMTVIRVPNGKDPADCVKEDPELWKESVETAPRYLDYYLSQTEARFDVSTIGGKKKAVEFFLPLLQRAESLERDHYIKQLGFVLQTDPAFIYDHYNDLKKDKYADNRTTGEQRPATSAAPSEQEYFVGMLLRFAGQVRKEILATPDEIFHEPIKSVYRAVCSQYNTEACVTVQALLETFDEDLQKRMDVLMMVAEARNAHLSDELIPEEMLKVSVRLLKADQDHQKAALMHKIRQAQDAQDSDLERKLFQDYSRLFQS